MFLLFVSRRWCDNNSSTCAIDWLIRICDQDIATVNMKVIVEC